MCIRDRLLCRGRGHGDLSLNDTAMEQDQPITVGHGKVGIMEGDKAATLLAVNAVTDKAQHMVAIGEIQGAVRFIHEHYRTAPCTMLRDVYKRQQEVRQNGPSRTPAPTDGYR